MRSYLSPLESAGKIDVEEEFHQSCFHISVYQSYGGAQQLKSETAAPARSAALLATHLH